MIECIKATILVNKLLFNMPLIVLICLVIFFIYEKAHEK